MAEFSEIIKALAIDAVEAGKPSCVMVGKVTKASPLEIKVSDKLTLTKEFLKVPESFTDHYIYMDIEKGAQTTYDFKVQGEGSEETSLNLTKGEIKKAKVKVYNALKKNDEVLLIRNPGGQQFIVLDRTVRAT